ncbi:MAG: ABC transporter ATP-binding protein [Clostridium sp.]|uniref:ABC transporter ATP-binding protein n=1 Tax=Clostridium sp. TaxID=1506 RepID=UPI003F36689B
MEELRLDGICKVYGKGESRVDALKNLNLGVEKGSMVAIMGASGCGKSTLLNILGCVDTPTGGKYFINGEEIDFKKINKFHEIRNKKVAFIFQNFALIKNLSVLENVILPLRFRKMKKREMISIAEKYLKELGIETLRNKKANELSGGQMQRVAIARTLTQETEIILADEPTGALDEENSKNIMEILKGLNKKYNKTIIVVTHDKLVSEYCDKVLLMKDGNFI